MKCILIVDDSLVVRHSLRALLQQHTDWTVCGEAENGEQGIQRAQELHPDLIVLDFLMPIMNGLQAARELRRLMPKIPLLMFTSFANPYVEKEALAAGVDSVIDKAGTMDALVSCIQTLLEAA